MYAENIDSLESYPEDMDDSTIVIGRVVLGWNGLPHGSGVSFGIAIIRSSQPKWRRPCDFPARFSKSAVLRF
jgi:hypothetical protein